MTDIEYLKKYLDDEALEEGLKQLKQGIPVQYIVGNVDFYGNIIEVNSNVLIPRFETEELVSKTYQYLKAYDFLDIADIGTGSGCIAIALKKMLDCTVDAVDISKEAIELAKLNAEHNNVDIHFYEGNILEPLSRKYDCIISNPPYISPSEKIMNIVDKNEPHLALYADHDGLYFYEEILKHCKPYLKDRALIAFEIGSNQKEAISSLIYQYFPASDFSIQKDMQGRDRFAFVFINY